VPAALGGVDGGHQRHPEQRLQRVARPRDQPVVRVHHLGPPAPEPGHQLHQLVVGDWPCGPRGHRRATTATQPSARSTRTPSTTASSGTVGEPGSCRCRLHTTTSWPARLHRPCQAVDVGGDATDDERRVLPGQHQHAHAANVAGSATGVRTGRAPGHVRSWSWCSQDLDLHLFGEGTHRRLWNLLGAGPLQDDGGAVRGVGPQRRGVEVLGDWNGWGGPRRCTAGQLGHLGDRLPCGEPGQRYKFLVHVGHGRTC
jgi:hypothetical protein